MRIVIKVCATLALMLLPITAHAGWGVTWTFSPMTGIVTNGSAFGNPPSPSGTQAAFVQMAGFIEQAFTAPAAGRYSISWQCASRWFVDLNHDYDVMVDGKALLRVQSWTLPVNKFNPLSVAVDLDAGPHTLRFQGINSKGGDHTSFLDSVMITPPAAVAVATPLLTNAEFDAVTYSAGSHVYTPPAVTSALAKLEARVATSGRSIYGRLVSVADGSYLPMLSMPTTPTVKANGKDVGPFKAIVNTGEHAGFMILLPDNVKVGSMDVVTISAPISWATVANDFAGAMDGQSVEVCTDRSFVGTPDDGPRTLKVGLNMNHQQNIYYGIYSLTKNIRFRSTWWFNGGVAETDANGWPTKLTQDTVTTILVTSLPENAIDATGTAMPEGLYAVGWGVSGGSRATCSLATGDADVTERTDLANSGGADGRGHVRVFQFKRKPGATRVEFGLSLQITDPARAPKFTYLVVYGPGDFKVADNTPTVLDDVDDPAALSAITKTRLDGGIGTARFVDGFIGFDNCNDACEPEHLQDEAQLWWNGVRGQWTVGYKQARPWTQQGAPYCYSPLFGDPFPATLATTLDAPAAGTKQVVQISDAATAPVIEGLVLQAGAERMRVLSVAGTAVTIERGSESTTPATYAAGPISVSGRLTLPSLDALGQRPQVVEMVCTGPHHLRTGNHPVLSGAAFATAWDMADGTKFNGGMAPLSWRLVVLVTAPDRFLLIGDAAKGTAGTTLPAAIALDPAAAYSPIVVPGSPGLPHTVAARLAGSMGSDLHLNFPFAASDSYVDTVAKMTLENLPAGHRVYIEYINEPWNWGYMTWRSQARFSWLAGRQPEGGFLWLVRRTGQIHKRFAAVFAAKGRAADVRSLINQQLAAAGGTVRWIVKQAVDEGLPPPDIAVAPYVAIGMQPPLVKALNTAHPDQAVDLWIYNLAYSTSTASAGTTVPFSAATRAAIDAVNKEFGTSVELYGYEGGVGESWPIVQASLTQDAAATDATLHVQDASLFSAGQFLKVEGEWVQVAGVAGNDISVTRGLASTAAAAHKAGAGVRNTFYESSHDITYNPFFRIAELDQFWLWQKHYDRMAMNGYAMGWAGGYHQWCIYHWFNQPPGLGDGSDGKADNRLSLATPGLPGSKGPNDNQDLRNVSVRGQALIEWNLAASKPKPKIPPVPAGLVAKASSPTSVDLSWTVSAGSTGYSVQRSPDGTAWAEVAKPTATTYTDPGLSGGTGYSYRVAATNAAGTSAYGPVVAVTTPVLPPSAPAGLAVSATSPASATVTWAAVLGSTGYSVQRSPDGTAWAEIAKPAKDVLTYVDSGLTPATAYSYRVAAIGSGGTSPYSVAAVVTTPPDLAAETADLNARAAAIGAKLVELSAQVDALKAAAQKLANDLAKKP